MLGRIIGIVLCILAVSYVVYLKKIEDQKYPWIDQQEHIKSDYLESPRISPLSVECEQLLADIGGLLSQKSAEEQALLKKQLADTEEQLKYVADPEIQADVCRQTREMMSILPVE